MRNIYNWSLRRRTFISANACGQFVRNYPGKIAGIGFEGKLMVLHFRLPF